MGRTREKRDEIRREYVTERDSDVAALDKEGWSNLDGYQGKRYVK